MSMSMDISIDQTGSIAAISPETPTRCQEIENRFEGNYAALISETLNAEQLMSDEMLCAEFNFKPNALSTMARPYPKEIIIEIYDRRYFFNGI